ncbi:hypothetical protein NKH77_39485 [Streptomyces sp. M19]
MAARPGPAGRPRLGDAFRAASVPVAGLSYFSGGRSLATFTIPPRLRPVQLPQYETERLLTERLHQLGGKIERGCGC